jgi:transcriptional regulator with XRE-family HTH domain
MINNKGGRKKIAKAGAPIITPDAKRLNTVFLEYGGSQNSFAKVLEVTQSYLSRMLTGEYPLTLKVVKNICYKLGYLPEWMLSGQGPKRRKGERPGKIMMDIAEFKTDLEILRVRFEKISARLKYVEDKVENQ